MQNKKEYMNNNYMKNNIVWAVYNKKGNIQELEKLESSLRIANEEILEWTIFKEEIIKRIKKIKGQFRKDLTLKKSENGWINIGDSVDGCDLEKI